MQRNIEIKARVDDIEALKGPPLMRDSIKLLSVLVLTGSFSIAHAQDPPPSSDIRCLIAGMQMTTLPDAPPRAVGGMLILYFFGRLDAYPPQVIEDAISKYAMNWTRTDLNAESERCGKELTEKGRLIPEIGKNILRPGIELEEKPHANPSPKAPPPEPLSAPAAIGAAPSGRTQPRIDPSHPLRIGEEYYPAESRRLQEEGRCVVRIQVDPDGHIRATQLLSSSGFPRLNEACLAAPADGRLMPATLDGKPISAWVELPIIWRLTGKSFAATPQIRNDYQLKIGPDDYPPISLKLHQEGDCVVHVDVGSDGTLSRVALTKPTGYEPLDQACLNAVKQAPFVPARQGTTPIPASTDINITWRYPWSETPAR
jgi:TonB family protein